MKEETMKKGTMKERATKEGAIKEEAIKEEAIKEEAVKEGAIKRAGPGDVNDAAALAQELWPDHTRGELAAELEALLSGTETAVFLWVCGREAQAFAQCQLRHDYVEGTRSSPVGYLEGIYVREALRGQGIGKKLVEACTAWARAMGCLEFASDCELENVQSRRFHLHCGFREAGQICCFVREAEADMRETGEMESAAEENVREVIPETCRAAKATTRQGISGAQPAAEDRERARGLRVRGLREEDYAQADRLMGQVHGLHAEGRPDIYRPCAHPLSEEAYKAMLSDPGSLLLGAEKDGVLAGICILSLRCREGHPLLKQGVTAYLEDLCVDVTCRRAGIGRALYRAAEEEARKAGAVRIDLSVWEFNRPAVRFYEKMGLLPQRQILEKEL